METYFNKDYPAGKVTEVALGTKAGKKSFVKGVDALLGLSDDDIRAAIRRAYPDGNEALESKMIARRDDIRAQRKQLLKRAGVTADDELDAQPTKTPKPPAKNVVPPPPVPGAPPEHSPAVAALLNDKPKGMQKKTADKIAADPNSAYAKKMAKVEAASTGSYGLSGCSRRRMRSCQRRAPRRMPTF